MDKEQQNKRDIQQNMADSVITNWVIEATSGHNDGWTQQHYRDLLQGLYDQLKDLEFLKKIKMTEQYWKREDGEVVAVGDMNEHHAKNVLRKVLNKSRQRGQDVLEMREKICQISNMLDEIKKDLL